MSTQETAYSLIAMCSYTGNKSGNNTLSFTHQLEGKDLKTVKSNRTITKISYNETDFKEAANLKLVNSSASKLFITVTVSGILLEGDKKSRSSGLEMSYRYSTLNGEEIKPEKINQGTEFQVEITLKNLTKNVHYKELALNQIFPSGWEIHNTRMDEGAFQSMARYQDFRDDRVFSYLDLKPGSSKTITVKLIAPYTGKFYLPSIYAEAMYDTKISALLPGKWVEVLK
jgi:uncharacterized protein YfaS (alpha-2-macroglobulin family)